MGDAPQMDYGDQPHYDQSQSERQLTEAQAIVRSSLAVTLLSQTKEIPDNWLDQSISHVLPDPILVEGLLWEIELHTGLPADFGLSQKLTDFLKEDRVARPFRELVEYLELLLDDYIKWVSALPAGDSLVHLLTNQSAEASEVSDWPSADAFAEATAELPESYFVDLPQAMPEEELPAEASSPEPWTSEPLAEPSVTEEEPAPPVTGNVGKSAMVFEAEDDRSEAQAAEAEMERKFGETEYERRAAEAEELRRVAEVEEARRAAEAHERESAQTDVLRASKVDRALQSLKEALKEYPADASSATLTRTGEIRNRERFAELLKALSQSESSPQPLSSRSVESDQSSTPPASAPPKPPQLAVPAAPFPPSITSTNTAAFSRGIHLRLAPEATEPQPVASSFLSGAGNVSASLNATLVRVFYATDRMQIPTLIRGPKYDKHRSPFGKLHFGECEVSIPKTHKTGKLESPSLLRFEFRPDPEKHIVLARTTSLAQEKFFESVSSAVQRSETREAFVFIHGYNVSFEDAARRTGQMAFDLNFIGAPIFYSWPSNGRTAAYIKDETNITWTAPHFEQFLSLLAQYSEANRIHIIAHSMGNRAVCESLKNLSLNPQNGIHFSHLILAAPDIDAETFAELAGALRQLTERITLYESSRDKALLASKKIHGYNRAGEPLLIIPGLDTIDASLIDTDFLGHSYFSDTWPLLSDIHAILFEDEEPSRRFGLQQMDNSAGKYYAFRR